MVELIICFHALVSCMGIVPSEVSARCLGVRRRVISSEPTDVAVVESASSGCGGRILQLQVFDYYPKTH